MTKMLRIFLTELTFLQTLFIAADLFAIASLVLPDWIVSEVGGDTKLGLHKSSPQMENISMKKLNFFENLNYFDPLLDLFLKNIFF